MNHSTVISYIITRWVLWVIMLIILGIVFIVFSHIAKIKKFRWWILVLLILVTIYVSVPTVQGILDITQNSYCIEYVEYYRADESNTRNQLLASESIQITTANGQTITLKGAGNDLPYGKLKGVITYAKRSKIVVSFEPD